MSYCQKQNGISQPPPFLHIYLYVYMYIVIFFLLHRDTSRVGREIFFLAHAFAIYARNIEVARTITGIYICLHLSVISGIATPLRLHGKNDDGRGAIKGRAIACERNRAVSPSRSFRVLYERANETCFITCRSGVASGIHRAR